jgi:GT2 family glycosyltransferase
MDIAQAPPGLLAILTRTISYAPFWQTVTSLQIPPGSSLITSEGTAISFQRNAAVEHLLANPELAWLWFLDDDHLIPPATCATLLAHNLPIVGGLYYTRRDPLRLTAMRLSRDEAGRPSAFHPLKPPLKPGLHQVDGMGMGCTLIRREVFEKVENPWFLADQYGLQNGEDFYFCLKAGDAGYKIYVDSSVRIGHLTTMAIRPSETGTVQMGFAPQMMEGAKAIVREAGS